MALLRRPLLLRYGIVPPVVTLAVLAQWAMLGARTPFVLILPAIIAVAWYGGLGPGLLATTLGALEVSYLFFEPRFSFRVKDPTDIFALAIFVFLGCTISLLCERLIQSERARRQAEARAILETEDVLRLGRERLRAVVETAADAIVTIDVKGIIQSVNKATERMFGYAAAEMIGRNVKMLMPAPYREDHDRYLERYLQTGEKHIIGIGREVKAQRKDGSTFPVDLAVSEVEHSQLFTGILRDISRRKQLEHEVVEIAVMEQRRIGQDLHDECGQQLTALGLMADSLVASLAKVAPADVEVASKIERGIRRVLRQVRNISRGLAVAELSPTGLPEALTELTARLSETSGIQCVFKGEEGVHVEDSLMATHLYHIAQEACTNALKHAQAKNIEVRLQSANHTVVLQIQDDGIGIANYAVDGLGIRIMRNRASVIGGRLTIDPAKPRGTLVTCTLKERDYATEQ